MDDKEIQEFRLYKDIQGRTGGEIYIGVVGPVRTGKSTFIKRFMDMCVLPFMEEGAEKERTIDELPQSAQGKNGHDNRTEIYSEKSGNPYFKR